MGCTVMLRVGPPTRSSSMRLPASSWLMRSMRSFGPAVWALLSAAGVAAGAACARAMRGRPASPSHPNFREGFPSNLGLKA